MGAGEIRPVRTRRTVATRINADRLQANVVEAAEQCGVLSIPTISRETDLAGALRDLEPQRLLVFCDEDAPVSNPLRALEGAAGSGAAVALLVGPEGGFDAAERAAILAREPVLRISLGPRILRADTAAVAALAVFQATLGDWR
jgi:16S rRNA (uracil1498-N3)-methyltransferase